MISQFMQNAYSVFISTLLILIKFIIFNEVVNYNKITTKGLQERKPTSEWDDGGKMGNKNK